RVDAGEDASQFTAGAAGATGGMVHPEDAHGRREGGAPHARGRRGATDAAGGLGESQGNGWRGRTHDGDGGRRECASGSSGETDGWRNFDVIPCADGKARRVEAGTFPLAYGIPARMGRLRGYGNAIVPAAAAQ